MRPLNALAKYALQQASKATVAYRMGVFGILDAREQSRRGNLRKQMTAARMKWYKETLETLEQDRRDAMEQGKTDALASALDAFGAKAPPIYQMMSAFDMHWSERTWNFIEMERVRLGISPSKSIWNAGKDAERTAYELIKSSEQLGISYNVIKKKLPALLTQKGKENIEYNAKRLWVDQLKRARIVAEKLVWQDMGYVKELVLSRSATAQPCEICDVNVGEGPLAERIVPADWNDLPPYHPWCQCDVRPAKPSAEDVAAFLKGQVGSPAVQAASTTPVFHPRTEE